MWKALAIGMVALVVSACGAAPAVLPAAPAAQSVQEQALFDRRVQKLVNDIMVAYDHNRNGRVETQRPVGNTFWQKIGNFLLWKDERVRSVTNTYSDSDSLSIATRVYTRAPLFFAADANQDQQITYVELQSFIGKTYDTNGDGELNARGLAFWREKNEIERFNSDFGERLISYRDIDLPINSRPGGTSSSMEPTPPLPPVANPMSEARRR